ncbi:hypothetical protein [Chitinophaga sancti]|uniref:Uncharacterized protein n=1 Tax=Chitinophaga sancti TaxID=1004 RepID=A0A1K1QSZ2_9BACT|nr:hypothetical protein [Chitinophaga sancti]WQD61882.1 hypothetical protein U0033_28770 [Chitinophaga sancti]WQG92549.1 hypothetical protein SR876_13615 [Chitinophaga sancti]SFW62893.1 hypothetical protein SAMN05661012_03015 [Chitinophaga sancti]
MFTLTVLAICFLAAISCKIKKVKAPVITQLMWYFHLTMLFFSLLCIILLISGYGFKGSYTEKVFFTFYAGSAIILYGLTQPEVSGKRVYLAAFYMFPFVLAAGLLLPPLRTLAVIMGLGLLSDAKMVRYRIDDDFALQTKSVDIIDRHPSFSLVQDKYYLFEKITSDVIMPERNILAVKMEKRGNDSVWLHLNMVEETGRGTKLDTTLSLYR